MYLSIDQSLTKSGICVFNKKEQLIHFEVFKTSKKEGSEEERILLLINRLEQLINEYNVEILILENLPYSISSRSVRVLAGVYYGILVLCKQLNINVYKYFPSEAKKVAGGGGNDKEDMINALPIEILEDFKSKAKKTTGLHDLADAYFLFKTYIAKDK
jgi:Holliday junction resolvasome RuvABC endonuclease subunit